MSEWISVEDVKFLLRFCPDEVTVPKGLNPMFYKTLSAEGDQEIADRLAEIRSKLPEPPKR